MTRDDDELLTAMSPKAGPLFQGFSAHTTPDQAKAMFRAKFGTDAATVIVTPGAVLAGPVPKARLWAMFEDGRLEASYPIEAEAPGKRPHNGRGIDWELVAQMDRDSYDQRMNAAAAYGGY